MTVRIGVEEEFHVIDVESGELVPRADAVLGKLARHADAYARELPQSVVESNSGVHESLEGLYADLSASRGRLDRAASSQGLGVAAVGTAPLTRLGTVPPTDDDRYLHMTGEYRRLADEQLICGAQVHVDVPDRDTAVRAMCAVNPWLPPLLALSASSPFWLGADTGYASWRTMVWQRWPTSGAPGCFGGAEEYDRAVDELVRSGVISDAGMIYYDVRPSAHLQTLELRICDACPRVETVVLIAALFRALVVDACREARTTGNAGCDGRHEWLRAATWRAARSGLEADLIDPSTRLPAPAPTVVRGMLRRLRPTLEEYGDWETVRSLTEEALAQGSAAHRLRRKAAKEDLLAAVDDILAETRGDGLRPVRGDRTRSRITRLPGRWDGRPAASAS
ncbi:MULTISPECIES: carboxylate-amine ligase [Streptomyces]|uniref:carboxylate-amine ligase n=1 Tax=Streptomyces TaxID=1883 RepID=UPI0013198065|nr:MULTISPECIES: glutamate--cysteine ligase [Streptomyces]QGZ47486.1 YbdK family carboxylate-amine ligase [Streptomyces sp. QHH-9511]GGT79217.1 putative glutamate--cysteine ligase 2-2 [Streptomyces lateritius]